jgi:hypothetical protein
MNPKIMQTILHKTRVKRAKKVCQNNHFLNNGKKKIEIKNYNKGSDKKVSSQACREFLILVDGKRDLLMLPYAHASIHYPKTNMHVYVKQLFYPKAEQKVWEPLPATGDPHQDKHHRLNGKYVNNKKK